MRKSCKTAILIHMIVIIFLFSTALSANENTPEITNISSGQFTVSWITEKPCKGTVKLYRDSLKTQEFSDDRGREYKGRTHYVTIKNLFPNTLYTFSIISNNQLNPENDQLYHVTTGPVLVPVGSIQPAGKVVLDDRKTAAAQSIAYVTILRDDKKSAMLSTLVDENGYWFIELINSRTSDHTRLYKITNKDRISLSFVGENGTANFIGKIFDNEGGTKLYPVIILK
ncbi:MAG: hypothetical protein OMM_04332 [Candidatus Magnetoglobus multicellularis str. Araruama]|jgi:hypothetical protein|uniref:Fibronectin type-III domain-containing protein n=1 Tax=Candidatus Magnetoglobus multicellularis str. Araruama TaxID=890399 RepID=A0A1V1P1Z4_9BACT|nr:MAG: hypothetical protein OMM_04332 [Candidatus Magnetoglobus multicellularis str. Araruama]